MSTSDLSTAGSSCDDEVCLIYGTLELTFPEDERWKAQLNYGHYATVTYVAVVAVFSVNYIRNRLLDRRMNKFDFTAKPSPIDRLNSAWRWIMYRKLPGELGKALDLPSAGVMILFVASFAMAAALTFVERPYYLPRRSMGSPPLGLRAGMIATALIPLVIVLAGKANFLSLITGIGHEKLNVVHRCISWIIALLSIVHIAPFLHQPLEEYGSEALKIIYYHDPGMGYTGTPTFAMLIFLTLFSLPVIRRWNYELFKRLHSFGAVVFLVLMFWHAANKSDSWHYLYATIAAWVSSALIRLSYKSANAGSFGRGFPTTVHRISSSMTKVDVRVPHTWTWHPGQHVFLRLLQVGVFDNHPFSIASIPGQLQHEQQRSQESGLAEVSISTRRNTLRFLIRAHSGFTKRLRQHCHLPLTVRSDVCLTAIVDGPYGTYIGPLWDLYDTVLLVAGGGGVSAVLPFLLHIGNSMKDSRSTTRHLQLIWMVREAECLNWIMKDIRDIWDAIPTGCRLDIDIYVTSSSSVASSLLSTPEREIFPRPPSPTWQGLSGPSSEKSLFDAKLYAEDHRLIHRDRPLSERNRENLSPKIYSTSSGPSLQKLDVFHSPAPKLHVGVRPVMGDMLDSIVSKCDGERVAVVGCGPSALKIDISNAVAAVQCRVWKGQVKEVMLHTEAFDW